jgi:hypothetical protein
MKSIKSDLEKEAEYRGRTDFLMGKPCEKRMYYVAKLDGSRDAAGCRELNKAYVRGWQAEQRKRGT